MEDAQNKSKENRRSLASTVKAEDAKLRRSSHEIDSYAHGRLVKFKKDKQRLQRVIEILEREKRDQDSLELLLDENVFYCPNCCTTYCTGDMGEEEVLLNSPHTEEDGSTGENPVVVQSDGHLETTDPEGDEVGNEGREGSKMKKKGSKPKQVLRVVKDGPVISPPNCTPFYLRHGYSENRYDPHYDRDRNRDSSNLRTRSLEAPVSEIFKPRSTYSI